MSGSRSALIFVLFQIGVPRRFLGQRGVLAQSGQRHLAASILDRLAPGPLTGEAGFADRRYQGVVDVVFLLDRELLGVQLDPLAFFVAVELRAAGRQEGKVVQAVVLG